MTEAEKLILAGMILLAGFGYQLFKIIRTDTAWVMRWGKIDGKWKFGNWAMTRKEHPKVFWFNIATNSAFVLLGAFFIFRALVSPETVR